MQENASVCAVCECDYWLDIETNNHQQYHPKKKRKEISLKVTVAVSQKLSSRSLLIVPSPHLLLHCNFLTHSLTPMIFFKNTNTLWTKENPKKQKGLKHSMKSKLG
jgi:hypothetical protein